VSLSKQLASLSPELRRSLTERGFDPAQLERWARGVEQAETARAKGELSEGAHSRLGGKVEPPRPGDIEDAPEPTAADYERLVETGRAALAQGEVAVCVLAGGMATRMGGVVKALVEALPGKTFLDLRLGEQQSLMQRFGAEVPLWLMTSQATHTKIGDVLGGRLDGRTLATFEQCCSLRLTPEGGLFEGDDGQPSVYATGHGDLPDALRASGLLREFIDRGGRYVWLENLDNLGATVDPALLGWHIAHDAQVSVELVDKEPGDRGGGPVRHDGRRIVTEMFRLPPSLDPDTIPVFNTNTFLVDAAPLCTEAIEFTFVEVRKTVDGRPAVQFERLIGEITASLETRFLRVPRRGARSRFLPVKDPEELKRRRSEIELIARERGLLGS